MEKTQKKKVFTIGFRTDLGTLNTIKKLSFSTGKTPSEIIREKFKK
jgi:predicted DNA-binding protein